MDVRLAVLGIEFSYLGLTRLHCIYRSRTVHKHCDWSRFSDRTAFINLLLSV